MMMTVRLRRLVLELRLPLVRQLVMVMDSLEALVESSKLLIVNGLQLPCWL